MGFWVMAPEIVVASIDGYKAEIQSLSTKLSTELILDCMKIDIQKANFNAAARSQVTYRSPVFQFTV